MEIEERGIKILKFEMKQIRPKIYTKKRSLIDQKGIESLSRTKTQ